ncbi:hypothetical protein BaRGS_00029642, partial [Batillaria attramentaria]
MDDKSTDASKLSPVSDREHKHHSNGYIAPSQGQTVTKSPSDSFASHSAGSGTLSEKSRSVTFDSFPRYLGEGVKSPQTPETPRLAASKVAGSPGSDAVCENGDWSEESHVGESSDSAKTVKTEVCLRPSGQARKAVHSWPASMHTSKTPKSQTRLQPSSSFDATGEKRKDPKAKDSRGDGQNAPSGREGATSSKERQTSSKERHTSSKERQTSSKEKHATSGSSRDKRVSSKDRHETKERHASKERRTSSKDAHSLKAAQSSPKDAQTSSKEPHTSSKNAHQASDERDEAGKKDDASSKPPSRSALRHKHTDVSLKLPPATVHVPQDKQILPKSPSSGLNTPSEKALSDVTSPDAESKKFLGGTRALLIQK